MANEKTTDQLTGYYNYLKKIKGLSDLTIYLYMGYHRRFRDQRLIQKNITNFITYKNNNSVCRGYMLSYLEFLKSDKEFDIPKVRSGTKKKRLVRKISHTEMEKIISYAYSQSTRNGLIVDLLYYGALRRFEINTIAVNLINFEKWFDDGCEGYCEMNIIGKGNKERIVLMHPRSIKNILNIYLGREVITTFMQKGEIIEKLRSLNEPLFKHINEKTIYTIARKSAERSIGRAIRTHEIRHARATFLEDHGAGVRDIQKYLGHSNLGTTEIYLHSDESKALDVIRGI